MNGIVHSKDVYVPCTYMRAWTSCSQGSSPVDGLANFCLGCEAKREHPSSHWDNSSSYKSISSGRPRTTPGLQHSHRLWCYRNTSRRSTRLPRNPSKQPQVVLDSFKCLKSWDLEKLRQISPRSPCPRLWACQSGARARTLTFFTSSGIRRKGAPYGRVTDQLPPPLSR
ncbi:hypothetical protein BJV74DRAFT_181611 [Russula compacta]|nr:hypothetical protein BJV74DRAFT_181611 [Russula compacta]